MHFPAHWYDTMKRQLEGWIRASDGSMAEEVREAIDSVRGSLTLHPDGSATLNEADVGAMTAYRRMIDGFLDAGDGSPAGGPDVLRPSKALRFLPPSAYETPQTFVREIERIMPQLVQEPPRCSFASLANFVYSEELIPHRTKKINFMRIVSAYDVFRRSPTLQSIPRDILQDVTAILKFLAAHRDRIVVENRQVPLSPRHPRRTGEFLYSILTLAEAVVASGLIHDATVRRELTSSTASSLQYALVRREVVEAELRRLRAMGVRRGYEKYASPAVFQRLKGAGENRSVYVADVLRWGWRLMSEPGWHLRSIFDGRELAQLALELDRREGVGSLLPSPVRAALAGVPSRTSEAPDVVRADVVRMLDEVLKDRLPTALSNPKSSLAQLECLVNWNRDALGEEPRPSEGFLATLRLAEEVNSERLIEDVSALYLYQHSSSLHALRASEIETPKALIATLTPMRARIMSELRAASLALSDGVERSALFTIAAVLAASGRLGSNTEPFLEEAWNRDILEASPALRNARIDPRAGIAVVRSQLQELGSIVTREAFAVGLLGEKEHIGLKRIIAILDSAGTFPAELRGQEENLMATDHVRDLYARSPILQSLRLEEGIEPKELIATLLQLRPEVVAEQKRQDPETPDQYEITTLLNAVISSGRVRRALLQEYFRYLDGSKVYSHSRVLQGIPDEACVSPEVLLPHLIARRSVYADERQGLEEDGTRRRHTYTPSLTSMLWALEAGGRLPKDIAAYLYFVGAYDRFEASPILQSIPREVIADDDALVRYLVPHRYRIRSKSCRTGGVWRRRRSASPKARSPIPSIACCNRSGLRGRSIARVFTG
jgi:hypothetical protein